MSLPLSAGEICNRVVVFGERRMPVVEAAQLMREHHVGCLVVVDEASAGRRVIGILTDRDLVTAVIAKDIPAATLVVEDVMSSDVVTAHESESISDLLATMRRKGLRRLPVTTPQGVLVGLVTLDDLLALMAEQLREMALTIESEQLRERRVRA